MNALRCPFLTRIPIGQVCQQATELLQLAGTCPVMEHVMKYASVASDGRGKTGHVLTRPKGTLQGENELDDVFVYKTL